MDSLAVAGWLGTQVDAALPGLLPEARLLLIGVICSLVLTGSRFLVTLLNQGESRVAVIWEKYREIINPIIAGLLGLLATGDWIGLVVGAAGRGIIKAGGSLVKGTASVAGVRKAKAVALALALGSSLLASGASAQGIVDETAAAPKADEASAWSRLAIAGGFGVRQDFLPDADLTGFLGVQVGYVWNDHVSPRVRLTRDLQQEAKWGFEAGLWFVL